MRCILERFLNVCYLNLLPVLSSLVCFVKTLIPEPLSRPTE